MSDISIYKRLREAQLGLHAPKNETGRFGKSRSAEAILEAAKPVLDKHGLTLVVSDEIVVIGERPYVKATASVYDEAGASISASAHAWEGEVDRGLDTSQVTGKTSSYARKYALGGLLAIDDTKDADRDIPSSESQKPAVGTSKPPEAPQAAQGPELATPVQKSRIMAFLRARGVEAENATASLITQYGIEDPKSMTKAQADALIKELAP